MNNIPVGVFDSGIGGISVLADMIKCLPGQRFIYYGDSKNVPYGTKSPEEVIKLTFNAAEFLLEKGAKALVVACNSITSVAIEELRKNIVVPVIGMEPALKPAIDTNTGGKIVVMATPLTIKEKKFCSLREKYSKNYDIISLACSGLADIIEHGEWSGPELNKYLENIFKDLKTNEVTEVVLGCTHYIFIKEEIKKYFPSTSRIIDGNEGTARQLKNILLSNNLYSEDLKIESIDEIIEFYFTQPNDNMLKKCNNWLKTSL